MKQIEVTILGQSYVLACPDDGEQRLLEAVGRVDTEMAKIRDAGKVRARERMAVLAALNLAYALTDARHSGAGQGGNLAASLVGQTPHETGEQYALIEQMVQRLDDALGQDGHLL